MRERISIGRVSNGQQSAKEKLERCNNPYVTLPRMVMLNLSVGPIICQIAMQASSNRSSEYSLSAEADGRKARSKYEDEVQEVVRFNWMVLFSETTVANPKRSPETTQAQSCARSVTKSPNRRPLRLGKQGRRRMQCNGNQFTLPA